MPFRPEVDRLAPIEVKLVILSRLRRLQKLLLAYIQFTYGLLPCETASESLISVDHCRHDLLPQWLDQTGFILV